MTKKITLSFGTEALTTTISNVFIDNYMADAHGSYVKVYIYLLRCLSDSSMTVSIANISDKLEETEKDICKALKYWEKKKLLRIKCDSEGEISNITITELGGQFEEESEGIPTRSASRVSLVLEKPACEVTDFSEEDEKSEPVQSTKTIPIDFSKPDYTIAQMKQFRQFDDFNLLIDYIEEQLGKTLTHRDLQTPAFLYECLGFSTDLIRYLYDYCISKNKRSSAYIEKVAREWSAGGVDSVEKAKIEVLSYSKEYSIVKTAFGLNRALGAVEADMLGKWISVYRMSGALIKEACDRTILSAGKPDFKYADGILKKWHEAGVTSPDDIAKLDAEHDARARVSKRSSSTTSTNKFTQFPQRKYTKEDYDRLELKKLKMLD